MRTPLPPVEGDVSNNYPVARETGVPDLSHIHAKRGSSAAGVLGYLPTTEQIVQSTLGARLVGRKGGVADLQYPCPKGVPTGLRYCKAQDREDMFAYLNYFYLKEGGVIVESGALDGLLHSTSWFFEQHLGWRAIHVEADPISYGELVSNRPNSTNIQAALCKSDQKLHWNGRGIVTMRGLYEYMSPEYIQRIFKEEIRMGVNIPNILPEVQCQSASDVFKQVGATHIDLWIVDLEGAEQAALEGFDFSAVTVDVLCIECLTGYEVNRGGLNETEKLEIDNRLTYLRANNYKCSYPFENPFPGEDYDQIRRNVNPAAARNCWCQRNDFQVKQWLPEPPPPVVQHATSGDSITPSQNA